MDAVPATIGGSRLLIEASATTAGPSAGSDEYGTKPTGIRDDVRDAYGQLKGLIRDISEDLGQALVANREDGPSEVSLELGLTFSSGANVWVLTASGAVSCTVSMTWTRG
ncbi:MAG TPA: CU044_2847 family protein [Dermatophilaceae bacterium]|nr:CU044_2847 family protein [Dermatophilaceae bacterium]